MDIGRYVAQLRDDLTAAAAAGRWLCLRGLAPLRRMAPRKRALTELFERTAE